MNGELFVRPARVDLTVDELELLREAASISSRLLPRSPGSLSGWGTGR